MRNGFDPISCVLILMRQSFNGGIPFRILVFPSPSNNGDVGYRRRRSVNSEEADGVVELMFMAAVERRRQHHRVAAAVGGAGDVNPLSSSQNSGPQLVPLRQLVVDDGDGAEHQLLQS